MAVDAVVDCGAAGAKASGGLMGEGVSFASCVQSSDTVGEGLPSLMNSALRRGRRTLEHNSATNFRELKQRVASDEAHSAL